MLGSMQPTSKFGEVFQYSNLMAGAAGYLGARVIAPKRELGAAYDEAMRTRIFAPAGMRNTTFDFAKATRGNYAKPHGDDVDGKTMVARMDLNYSIVPLRPAGGVWTSAHDFIRYVQLELGQGTLPNGRRLVSAQNVTARLAPQVLVSEDIHYGMGLFVDRRWGVTVIHHGGDLAGYHSDMMWLPEYGVGAVILTNADSGVLIRGPLLRRLLEVLFDGKPEAEQQLKVAAAQRKAALAKDRERLVVPADPAAVEKLAARYANTSLGEVKVVKNGKTTTFDVGEWKSTVASRKNDDGTTSFITIDPTLGGFEFVVADKDGKRRLITRDAQHEYVLDEVAAKN
jgi:CubicO group peptidase (beta-lactamase class C family)